MMHVPSLYHMLFALVYVYKLPQHWADVYIHMYIVCTRFDVVVTRMQLWFVCWTV